MMVIGIVGGIASGKSLVAKCFQQLGAAVLDADRIGHEVLRMPGVKNAIRAQWGEAVFDASGQISRSAMADSVFGLDPESRARLGQLEKLTHPIIGEHMHDEIERLRQIRSVVAVVVDAPVLIKAGWHRLCDKVVFVEANSETRQRRALIRGWSAEEWKTREALQTPLGESRKIADAVIDNSASPAEVERLVRELWRKWKLSKS